MDVQSAAALFLERLGHEGRDHAVLACRRLDDAFQQYRVIAGQDRIVDMPQVNLELARRIFGDRGLRRNVLCLAPVVYIIQECLDLPEVVVALYLGARLWPADGRYP